MASFLRCLCLPLLDLKLIHYRLWNYPISGGHKKLRSNPKRDETARTPLSPWTPGHRISTMNPKDYAITTCDDPIQCPSLGHRWTVDTSCTKSAWVKIADNRVTVERKTPSAKWPCPIT